MTEVGGRGRTMKLVVQLAANRGELDVEADSVSVESGALVACRDGEPILILASRVWTVVHPAGERPKRPQPPLPDVSAAFPPTRQAEPPESSEILEQAVIPDTVRRGW